MSFPKAIHMETDPQTISAYLIYLSQHAPVGEQGLHNDLALVRVHLSHKRRGIDLLVDDYDTVRVMRVFALCVCVYVSGCSPADCGALHYHEQSVL